MVGLNKEREMKRVLLSVFMLMGLMGVSFAQQSASLSKGSAVSDAHCALKLADARAGLKGLEVVGFAPRSQSADGNRVVGFMMYHNPASKDAKSVDALALVLTDKTMPDKELTFLVVYIGPKQSVVYKREIKEKDGKQALGPCFQKTLEDNPQQ